MTNKIVVKKTACCLRKERLQKGLADTYRFSTASKKDIKVYIRRNKNEKMFGYYAIFWFFVDCFGVPDFDKRSRVEEQVSWRK
jgi:hypothetical protein